MLVPLDAVPEGTVVAAEVRDALGRVLLGRGLAVTERHLRIFRMCGVEALEVERPEDAEGVLTPEEEARLAELRTALAPRFALAQPAQQPPVAALAEFCALRQLRRAKTGGSHGRR